MMDGITMVDGGLGAVVPWCLNMKDNGAVNGSRAATVEARESIGGYGASFHASTPDMAMGAALVALTQTGARGVGCSG